MARSRLKPVSPKRAKLNREYERVVQEWWTGHDGQCEFRFWVQSKWHDAGPSPRTYLEPSTRRCPNKAERRPHHMKKRGRYLCAKETFLGLCFPCHIGWLHNNEEEARRLGYLLDRPAKPL